MNALYTCCVFRGGGGVSPLFMAHGSGVIVQLAGPEPDLVTMMSSVVPLALSDRVGHPGPIRQDYASGPLR